MNAKYEWQDLPWRTIEQQVFKLQKRIYQASQRGDAKVVHHLQKLLMHSWAAKCLAVRRVTQDNRGKRTPGVDGVASLSPAERMLLVASLRLPQKAQPLRRVWIPKPGTQERRPLGIPTIHDRAVQALAKLALEPEWEARFEPNSYGFRPGRSCHDAREAIFISIKQKAKFVLDADIAKCFDRINHDALLTKLHTFPTLRRAISAWLKAGVMEGEELFPTNEGTPQGGTISPLLANIALHGLETAIVSAFPERHRIAGIQVLGRPSVVRYADDFVVLHPELATVKRAQQLATQWLADMGLELKPSKTRITHTLLHYEGSVGFDFLGFNVRQYPVGKTHSGKDRGGHLLGFKTLIKPSKEKLKLHGRAMAEIVHAHRAAPQAALVSRLNPLIRGWANYYSGTVARRDFAKADSLVFRLLLRWAKRRHPHKPVHWIVRKYWRIEELRRWDFATLEGHRLYKHRWTPIQRHLKVQGRRSYFDGDWAYWGTRLGRHPELSASWASLLKRQHGRCAWCGLTFTHDDELMESDHRIPKSLGGKNGNDNRQLLHGHCHDQKTARDGSLTKRGTHNTSQ